MQHLQPQRRPPRSNMLPRLPAARNVVSRPDPLITTLAYALCHTQIVIAAHSTAATSGGAA
jgi:hypothetical protein